MQTIGVTSGSITDSRKNQLGITRGGLQPFSFNLSLIYVIVMFTFSLFRGN